METKTLISIVVALVVVGGGVWYVSSHRMDTSMDQTGTQATEETAEGSGTLAELMARTGSYKCTVTMAPSAKNQNTASSGTVYVGNGNMRGDFTTTIAAMGGKTVASHMISSDGYVYTWSDMMPQGVKMQIDTSTVATAQGSVDATAAIDYHCSPWSVEASQFTVPTNITFTAVGATR